jgi:hypothetical protein
MDILAWDLVKAMLSKSLDPILQHTNNGFVNVEDHIIGQLEVDRSSLLMNQRLVEGLIDNVVEIT